MSRRLIRFFIVAVFALSGPVASAKVSSGNVPQQDLLLLLPESFANDDLHERGFCYLKPVSMSMGGEEFSGASFANARVEQRCVLPVPPRDTLENIAWTR